MRSSAGKRAIFWGAGSAVVIADVITKALAVQNLSQSRMPHPILGDWLTFQLVYNRGAAFGISAGPYSRWIFLSLAVVALVVLVSMLRHTRPSETAKILALGLVCGGAVGNVIDRIRSARGVVDFIDVGIGAYRWPTFNVADMAVTVGAVSLALVLWLEGRQAEATQPDSSNPVKASS